MKPTVYIETTFISYLTAWPSRDLIRAAQQQVTREWWTTQRQQFDLHSSQLLHLECAAGNAEAAQERLAVVDQLPLLDAGPSATAVAKALVDRLAIPMVAARDALHVGICAEHALSFLLTWNFKHLANAQMLDMIREVCESLGYRCPVICSPEALF